MSGMDDQLKEINRKLDKINQREAENRCINNMEKIYKKFPFPYEKQSTNYTPYNGDMYGFFTLFGSLVLVIIGLIIYYIEHDFEKYSWYETSYTLYFFYFNIILAWSIWSCCLSNFINQEVRANLLRSL